MANRTIATPGHYGGSGFDPLSSYSPSPDPNPVPAVSNPGAGALGSLISLGVVGLALWVMSKFEGDNKDSDQRKGPLMQHCVNGHNNSLYARACAECGVLLPDPDLDGFGGI